MLWLHGSKDGPIFCTYIAQQDVQILKVGKSWHGTTGNASMLI